MQARRWWRISQPVALDVIRVMAPDLFGGQAVLLRRVFVKPRARMRVRVQPCLHPALRCLIQLESEVPVNAAYAAHRVIHEVAEIHVEETLGIAVAHLERALDPDFP